MSFGTTLQDSLPVGTDMRQFEKGVDVSVGGLPFKFSITQIMRLPTLVAQLNDEIRTGKWGKPVEELDGAVKVLFVNRSPAYFAVLHDYVCLNQLHPITPEVEDEFLYYGVVVGESFTKEYARYLKSDLGVEGLSTKLLNLSDQEVFQDVSTPVKHSYSYTLKQSNVKKFVRGRKMRLYLPMPDTMTLEQMRVVLQEVLDVSVEYVGWVETLDESGVVSRSRTGVNLFKRFFQEWKFAIMQYRSFHVRHIPNLDALCTGEHIGPVTGDDKQNALTSLKSRVNGVKQLLDAVSSLEFRVQRSKEMIVHAREVLSDFGEFRDNFCVAGGYALSAVVGGRVGDMDIFMCKRPETDAEVKRMLEDAVTRICENNPGMTVTRTQRAINLSMFNNGMTMQYQIVLLSTNSVEEVLRRFDVDCCAVAITSDRFVCTERAGYAIRHRVNHTSLEWSTDTYEMRMKKYMNKGFEVMVPSFDIRLVDLKDRSGNTRMGLDALFSSAMDGLYGSAPKSDDRKAVMTSAAKIVQYPYVYELLHMYVESHLQESHGLNVSLAETDGEVEVDDDVNVNQDVVMTAYELRVTAGKVSDEDEMVKYRANIVRSFEHNMIDADTYDDMIDEFDRMFDILTIRNLVKDCVLLGQNYNLEEAERLKTMCALRFGLRQLGPIRLRLEEYLKLLSRGVSVRLKLSSAISEGSLAIYLQKEDVEVVRGQEDEEEEDENVEEDEEEQHSGSESDDDTDFGTVFRGKSRDRRARRRELRQNRDAKTHVDHRYRGVTEWREMNVPAKINHKARFSSYGLLVEHMSILLGFKRPVCVYVGDVSWKSNWSRATESYKNIVKATLDPQHQLSLFERVVLSLTTSLSSLQIRLLNDENIYKEPHLGDILAKIKELVGTSRGRCVFLGSGEKAAVEYRELERMFINLPDILKVIQPGQEFKVAIKLIKSQIDDYYNAWYGRTYPIKLLKRY